MSAFMAAFKALMACSTMLGNGLYGVQLFKLRIWTSNSRIVVGWCAVINENHIFDSFASRFSLACARKSLNLCLVIPPRNDE